MKNLIRIQDTSACLKVPSTCCWYLYLFLKNKWDKISFPQNPFVHPSGVYMSSRLLIFQKSLAYSKSRLQLKHKLRQAESLVLPQKNGLHSHEKRNSFWKETNIEFPDIKIHGNRRYTRQKDSSLYLLAERKSLWEYLCKIFLAKCVGCWGFGHLVCTCHFASTERNIYIHFKVASSLIQLCWSL